MRFLQQQVNALMYARPMLLMQMTSINQANNGDNGAKKTYQFRHILLIATYESTPTVASEVQRLLWV